MKANVGVVLETKQKPILYFGISIQTEYNHCVVYCIEVRVYLGYRPHLKIIHKHEEPVWFVYFLIFSCL